MNGEDQRRSSRVAHGTGAYGPGRLRKGDGLPAAPVLLFMLREAQTAKRAAPPM